MQKSDAAGKCGVEPVHHRHAVQGKVDGAQNPFEQHAQHNEQHQHRQDIDDHIHNRLIEIIAERDDAALPVRRVLNVALDRAAQRDRHIRILDQIIEIAFGHVRRHIVHALDACGADVFIALEIVKHAAVERFGVFHDAGRDRDQQQRDEQRQHGDAEVDRRIDRAAVMSRQDA